MNNKTKSGTHNDLLTFYQGFNRGFIRLIIV